MRGAFSDAPGLIHRQGEAWGASHRRLRSRHRGVQGDHNAYAGVLTRGRGNGARLPAV